MKHIKVGFSIHRPEMIPKTAELMAVHDAIFLEEPPVPEYEKIRQHARRSNNDFEDDSD